MVGRHAVRAHLLSQFRGGHPPPQILLGVRGVGKTTLLEGLAEDLKAEYQTIWLRASPALADVPFGVMAQFPGTPSGAFAAAPAAVLKAIWQHSRRSLAQDPGAVAFGTADNATLPILLVLDNADSVDESSAAVLSEALAAGWVKLIAAGQTWANLPRALRDLWRTGMGQRVDVQGFGLTEVGEYLGLELESTIPAAVTSAFHAASGGNPLLLSRLLRDARADGALTQKHDLWLVVRRLPERGPGLLSLAGQILAELPVADREAMQLISLAGPVARAAIEEICGAATVESLLQRVLIKQTGAVPAEVSIAPDIMTGSIRAQVLPAKSRYLRHKMVLATTGQAMMANGYSELRARGGSSTTAGMLAGSHSSGSEVSRCRSVEWGLETGEQFSVAQLLDGASLAIRLDRLDGARAMLGAPVIEAAGPRAQALLGRVEFSLGNVVRAAELLETSRANLVDGDDTALGAAVDALLAAALRSQGIAPNVPLPSGTSVSTSLRVLESSLRCMEQINTGALEVALTTMERAAIAAKSLDCTVYYFQDMTTMAANFVHIGLGEWTTAEAELLAFERRHPESLQLFGGTVTALRGYSRLRQGRIDTGYQVLLPAVESLRIHDPLQVLRFSTALAFYAAARRADEVQARRLLAEYHAAVPVDGVGWRLRSAAYIAAGEEYLNRDGRGLAHLRTMSTAPDVTARDAVLLELLGLRVALRDYTEMGLLSRVAANVQGRRALAAGQLSTAFLAADPHVLMELGHGFVLQDFVNLAHEAYRRAESIFASTHQARLSRQASQLRERCEQDLGSGYQDGHFVKTIPTVQLTRRERDVAALAARGFSDKEIAQHLMVSVRTVEGHLYRTYIKLGVRSRDELNPGSPGETK
ncbi:LuxR C-terminal-related transcriptional regulator [Pseudarthrobacter sp. PS3-L1]|uniref:LuxR C-terminal-related transcriptional regulator n=1 Tax=Pseudarthrobacter sp. PS3-L1 TaxID=3046207 RepID=UPI0024BAB3C6|nr:LuxR C-terminal-related transcriptional regulator [Pseudarthrobacter sp. PS3-L1]MDJ0319665.1 LuxR C-terminal-related transcriptional regulator [Pseudarthrobacter sp. PS3-L1]